MRLRVLTAALVAIFGLIAATSRAQTGSNVLVVANDAAPGSAAIAERYVAARHVPDDQLLHVRTSFSGASSDISRAEFERDIQAPIALWLGAHSRQDRILYIVLTRGIPLRIAGTGGRSGAGASVDSELAVLYRRMAGQTVLANGAVRNPYFLADAEIGTAKPFSHTTYDIYLVTRLDGFTVADALALIDRGAAPVKEGRILLDAPPVTNDPRNAWFQTTAARLAAGGLGGRVVHDSTSRALQGQSDVLGYYSWGSNDPALALRSPNLTFVPGALASMFLSSDARTFTEPPAAWAPSVAMRDAYAGSSQSLIGDLVRSGVTGIAGQVAEPFLDGAVRPDILFPAYVAGFNLAEAFYLGLPYLSWQTVVVGDPLCAPFRTTALTVEDADADPPIDPVTELPTRFSARRLAAVQGRFKPDAVKLMLRAESRLSRSDPAGATDALKEAVSADSALAPAWRLLASAHEQAGRYAEADEAYRRLLELDRDDFIALNNLAYSVAVRRQKPQEALALATRASSLAPRNATVADTLGWVHHLLGNDEEAVRWLDAASRALPDHAEVQLHAAVVYASIGRLEDAARALKSAGTLDPSLRERPEFRDVQRKIGL